MTAAIKIHLLGKFEVYRQDQLLSSQDWRSQQTRAIAKILLARQGEVVTGDQLSEILWPGEAPEALRSRLHVRISQLRNALGAGKTLIQTVDGGYRFQQTNDCWLDIEAFQSYLQQARQAQEDGQQLAAIQAYEHARELYRGDFLAEDLYADWAFSEREYYRERFITALLELSEAYAQQGRYRLAIARIQQALARDLLRESIYVRLMFYHYYAGERAQALRVFERCQQMLRNELEVEPLPTTVELAEKIQAGTLWRHETAPRYPPPIYSGRLFEVPYSLSETPLVGRAREYAWLVERWQAGKQKTILIAGEAGIGKSRLLEAFTGYLQERGSRVLRARVAPGEYPVFEPVVKALQPLLNSSGSQNLPATSLAALARLFPQIASQQPLPQLPELSPERERQRLLEAVGALARANHRPLTLLWIDDAHRLGAAACEMLLHLSDTFQVVLSFRSEETPPEHPLHTVFSSADLRLETLSQIDIETLVQQLAGRQLPEITPQLAELSGGNPLFVVTLLQHLFEAGQLYVDASGSWGLANTEPISLPATVRATIEARLQRLDRKQRSVFDYAAVLGGEFDFELLQAASQQPEDQLLSTLDALSDAALILEPRSQGRCEFAISHDRYTEVACATLPAIRCKQMHRQAAEAIEKLYGSQLSDHYPALSEHYHLAEDSQRTAHYAGLAGKQAAGQFANAEALQHLNRALALASTFEAGQQAELLLVREQVYDLQGARQQQAADLETLAALSPKLDIRQQAEIHLRRAGYEWLLGQDQRAEAALQDSLAQAQACQAMDLLAAAYALQGRMRRDQELASQALVKGLKLARQAGLQALEGDILRWLGNSHFWQHQYPQSQHYLEEALAVHRIVGDLRGELSALNNLGWLSQQVGQPRQALDFYQQALASCQKIGDRLAEGVLLANLGNLTAQLGDYLPAQEWLEQALTIREDIENEEGVGTVLNHLGEIHQQQGQYGSALACYQRALEINTTVQHPGQRCESLTGLASLYRELGAYQKAEWYHEQALQANQDPQSPQLAAALAHASLLYHELGQHQRALEAGVQALELGKAVPRIAASAQTHSALALSGLQRYEEARQHFQQVRELRQSLSQPHLVPEALAGLASLDMAEERWVEAHHQVEAILHIWEQSPAAGPAQLPGLYLTCYRVLQHRQDGRAAMILRTAQEILQARAATIPDAGLRQSYLQGVRANQELLGL